MTAPAPSIAPSLRDEARLLYWQGWRIADIARKTGENVNTIYSWKKRDDWDSTPVIRRVEATIDARLVQLINKEDKRPGDLQEIEVLTRQLERTARIRQYDQSGNEADINPKIRNRNRGRKKQKKRNEISEEGIGKLEDAFRESLFSYQDTWREARLAQRIRNILKSRQIGATWYFAREAFINAIKTGDNQIFLSASKAQAHVFRAYMIQFVREVLELDLSGGIDGPLRIHTEYGDPELYFLGTNARTAQSYHGHLYLDEYFWIQRFLELRKVASGMAMHKKWTQTYFSTPSTVTHEAYPFWTGEAYNRGRPKDQHIHLDVRHKVLAEGRHCEDGHWRHMVTVEDAVAGGCDLFDIEQLRLEYNEHEFRNLLLCEFVDDTASIFTLSMLQPCMVDSWVVWDDFRPFAPRPVGDRAVWVGYDPSRTRDGASVTVVVPPVVEGAKFRVVEKQTWHNMPFPQQAERIRQITNRYRVEHLEIDCTGPGGLGVHDLVREFFPAARKVFYTPQVKAELVAKALNIITNGRLEYDAGWKDLTMALMAIRRTTTDSGGQITYTSGRSEDTGHADLAWALMHALNRAQITAGGGPGRKSTLEIM